MHYALYKKPREYDDVTYGEYFWQYAKLSPFYGEICERKQKFGDAERAQKDATAQIIREHAIKIVNSEDSFSSKLLVHSEAIEAKNGKRGSFFLRK